MDKNGVNEYLVSVAMASAVGVISDILCISVGKSRGGIEKYIKFGLILSIIGCIIIPGAKNYGFEDIFRDLPLAAEAGNVADGDSMYILERECEEKCADYIFENTGIKVNGVSIDMITENGEVSVVNAEIMLSLKDKESEERVRLAAAEALGSETVITYEN